MFFLGRLQLKDPAVNYCVIIFLCVCIGQDYFMSTLFVATPYSMADIVALMQANIKDSLFCVQILIEFLGKCTITSDIKLKDHPWTKLLPMCPNPATSAEALQLVDFICNVGLKYKEENQPLDFILTLLQHEFLLGELGVKIVSVSYMHLG